MIIVQTRPCPECKQVSLVEIPDESVGKYKKWEYGDMLIQNAFPEWSVDQRELLVTGTHSQCWTKMFSGDEY